MIQVTACILCARSGQGEPVVGHRGRYEPERTGRD
jgi:hypothetical protein